MSENTTDGNKAEPRRKVGDILRDARIVRDEELKEVAKALAIRLPFMEAIEDSRPNDLPGAAYALGFVRSYADYLGMDSKALVERYKEEAKELEHETSLHFPEPLPSRKVPIGALLFIGIILVLLFYGVWWYLNNQGKNLADIVPVLSGEQTEMVEATSSEPTTSIVEEVETPTEETVTTVADTETAIAPVVEKTEEAVDTAMEATAEAVEEVATETTEVIEEAAAVIEDSVDTATETVEEASTTGTTEVMETTTANTEVPTVVEQVAEAVSPEVGSTPATEAATETTTTATETVGEVETAPSNVTEEAAEVVTEVAEEVGEEAEQVVEKVAEVTTPASAVETEASTETATDASIVTSTISDERKERVYGEENTNSRVTILAKESAWVEVSDASGELTLTRLLRKGDRYLVPNQSGLTMVTGNAGGVYILVDGKEIGPSGPVGAVRRDFLLDADSLLATQTSENTTNSDN